MAKSLDLDYQRQAIHKLLKNPLPLANSGTAWNPFYFNDVTQSQTYSKLKDEVVRTTNTTSGQDTFLINIVQGKQPRTREWSTFTDGGSEWCG